MGTGCKMFNDDGNCIDECIEEGEISGMTCAASTEYSSSFSCEKAIDGNANTDWATLGQGAGAWIQLDFNRMFYVRSLAFKHRRGAELFKDLSLEFSDGQIVGPFTMDNIGGGSKTFILPRNILSSFVKITAISHYSKVNNGFAEIDVHGCP